MLENKKEHNLKLADSENREHVQVFNNVNRSIQKSSHSSNVLPTVFQQKGVVSEYLGEIVIAKAG